MSTTPTDKDDDSQNMILTPPGRGKTATLTSKGNYETVVVQCDSVEEADPYETLREAEALLRRALSAFNEKPRFTWNDRGTRDDSYKLAADITRFLQR